MTKYERGQFVEDLALALDFMGLPRMPSRVFAAVLSSESGSLTARELADDLHVSPAAISGAVNYLTRLQMMSRSRRPGERSDHYEIGEDFWFNAAANEAQSYQTFLGIIDRGLEADVFESSARKRVEETRAFFAFIAAEMPLLLQRWRDSKSS
jgi:DNA-binding transcriptional regulator GbsR (MarR family)